MARGISIPNELTIGAGALAYHALVHRVLPRSTHVPANLAAAATAVAIARRDGASWRDLGLDPHDAPRGLALGALAAVPIALVVGAGLAIPFTRDLFRHDGAETATGGRAAYELLVRIPLATAAAEEVIFRGALGAVGGRRGAVVGVAISSLAFGVWHVIPTLEAPHTNPVHARAGDRDPRVLTAGAVVSAVATTAAAGVGFAWLRARSRSVVAPIVAHAALNSLGYVATLALAARRGDAVRASAVVTA